MLKRILKVVVKGVVAVGMSGGVLFIQCIQIAETESMVVVIGCCCCACSHSSGT